MYTFDESVQCLFNEVHEEISHNVRHMMEQLWLNWSHLGVEHAVKQANIRKLVQIEKELHRDVILETEHKLKALQDEVDKIREEAEKLGLYLSVEITIEDFKNNMLLIDYKTNLENQIAGYREQVEQRKVKMERLFEWQRDLAEKLGVTITEMKEIPLPSDDQLYELQCRLEQLQAERDKRVHIFLNTQIEVKELMESLGVKPETKFESLVVTSLSVNFKVTDVNMERLAKLLQNLQQQYELTNNRVLELRERLSRLWECLEEDRVYQENFLKANPGCGPTSERAIREEIARCQQIKKQKIEVFVSKIRTKIKLLWDNCLYSPKDREEFVQYYQDIFTEDTLSLHELYLDKLTKFYSEYCQIFEMVAMRRELWNKMCELEARASEPGRYHNRGGQLLKEEKQRKTIASKLPKIESQLQELVKEYEGKTGKIFTVDGKPLLQLIQDEWESKEVERQNKMSARKLALNPDTPQMRTMLAVSPLGKRNRTAAGLPGTAERNRLAPKRPLVTASASKAATTYNNLSALKRSAISTIKRRVSGRLAARTGAEAEKVEGPRRKLNYLSPQKHNVPRLAVNGSILKHKRRSNGKRRSGSKRRSVNGTLSSLSQDETEHAPAKKVTDSTLLSCTYTDFKEHIHDKQTSRSSLAANKPQPAKLLQSSKLQNHTPIREMTPKKTPISRIPAVFTPKIGKENIQHKNDLQMTPKLYMTPNRVTRSALKPDKDGFATPRAPFSASKANLQRQNTASSLSTKTTPTQFSRSQTSHVISAFRR